MGDEMQIKFGLLDLKDGGDLGDEHVQRKCGTGNDKADPMLNQVPYLESICGSRGIAPSFVRYIGDRWLASCPSIFPSGKESMVLTAEEPRCCGEEKRLCRCQE
jgi:hypothetical protein